MTSEKLDKLDELEETLKDFIINDAEYYVSDSANVNDAKGNPASDLKTFTYTSDGKKINITDISNAIFQQALLSNRTLPIVTTTMDPSINDRIVTCDGSPHTLAMPTTK